MKQNVVKAVITSIGSFLASILGILYVPVLLMVLCNLIDYITGLLASKYRAEHINSYKSFRGIAKKICMWILVVVGAIVDKLIAYAVEAIGIAMPFTFLIACIVAIWIVCNELISILENIIDIGVWVPAFMSPLIKNIKSKAEGMVETEGMIESESNKREGGR